jgi:probable HAF family extracellular repeat protein
MITKETLLRQKRDKEVGKETSCMSRKSRETITVLGCLSLTMLVSPAWSDCLPSSGTIAGLPGFPNDAYQINGLNSAGQLTGFILAGTQPEHAFVLGSGGPLDIGTLGGPVSRGRAINAAGQIAGDAMNSAGETHAIFFDGTNVLDLGTLGGSSASAAVLNDHGQAAGASLLAGDAQTQAFIFANGALTGLGTLGGAYSSAFAINNSGTVVGESAVSSSDIHGFVFVNGTMQDLGTLGGTYGSAFAVNDAGTIAGESSVATGDTHGFVYANGTMQDLGTLGGTYSSGYYVNQSGQVLGISSVAGDLDYHAFLFSAGQATDLGTLGGSNNYPYALNDAGQVVGQSQTADGTWHAYVWANGTILDLNSLLPTNSGWELENAILINLSARIVGIGIYGGLEQWFVMDLAFADTTRPTIHAPGAITLSADANCSGTVPDLSAQVVVSDDCTPVGALKVTQVPAAGTPVGLGKYLIKTTVTDLSGNKSTARTILKVVDNTPPVILSSPASLTVAVGDDCQAAVPDVLAAVAALDACTPSNQLVFAQSPEAGTMVGKGHRSIRVVVKDLAGNKAHVEIPLDVVDVTAPVIQSISATPATLAPANHKLMAISVAVDALDNCDSSPNSKIVSITANETVDANDIKITGRLTAKLAASRNGASARVYTITVQCTDNSGNSSLRTVTVTVP